MLNGLAAGLAIVPSLPDMQVSPHRLRLFLLCAPSVHNRLFTHRLSQLGLALEEEQLAVCAAWNGLFAGGGALGAQIAVAIRAATGSFAAATCFLAAAGGLGAAVLAGAVLKPDWDCCSRGRRAGALKAALLPEDPPGINS